MAYKLLLTETYQRRYHAALDYMVHQLHNPVAAEQLLAEVDKCYVLLAGSPYIYSVAHDTFLSSRGYRQAPIKGFLITYTIAEDIKTVYLMGFSHQRQDQAFALI